MGPLIVRRLLVSMPALVGVLFLCFCLMKVAPTDLALIIAGADASPEVIAGIRKDLGLDRPLVVQYFDHHVNVAQGDLGRAIISNQSVAEELADTVGPTVELMVGGMLRQVDHRSADPAADGAHRRLGAVQGTGDRPRPGGGQAHRRSGGRDVPRKAG